ncbi:16S rRNA (uracil1498-N3)-methyltransferase [Formivibrio citricus]|uniref:Ribosomal RNA small subunit methyltransferase E n=1 Tax=Formivibrio citricus TaxID=83765 RepID=A0A1I4VP22_9NEIS|nr:16S rRNA (uracil(1498)-N(3))-methyltransferase [Formivibrio citricus]SFN03051.1 16S rRNA (uracil1498-N3)-methyltransferase [Formivibrio citricus]
MPRFYVDLPLDAGAQLELPETAARHVQVLRMQPGEPLVLFNGRGGEFAATVLKMGKRSVLVEVGAHDPVERESPLQLTIVQALSAAERMDYTVQKSAELGVTAIQPVISEFCQSRYSGERAEKRIAHWQAVAMSACEQCGRTRIPQILPILKYEDYLASAPAADLRVLLSPDGAIHHSRLPTQASSVCVLIGAEGGFSRREESDAVEAGFIPLILGPRIFRTETVAPVIAGLLQSRYGDW